MKALQPWNTVILQANLREFIPTFDLEAFAAVSPYSMVGGLSFRRLTLKRLLKKSSR